MVLVAVDCVPPPSEILTAPGSFLPRLMFPEMHVVLEQRQDYQVASWLPERHNLLE